MRRLIPICAVVMVVSAAGISGCAAGADDDLSTGNGLACIPGQTVACGCVDGTASEQACNPDGLSFAPCACGTGTSTRGLGTAGTGGIANDGSNAAGAAAPMPGPIAGMGAGGAGMAAALPGAAGSGSAGMAGSATAGMGGTPLDPGAMAGTGGGATGEDVPASDHCQPVADWDPEWAAFEEEVLRLVNQNRAMGWNCNDEGQFAAAGPLTMDPILRCAARLHSQDMGQRGYFDHQSPEGEGPSARMAAAGYMGGTYGENIARGQSTPEGVVSGWMGSDGHCANIMRSQFTEIGIGFWQGDARGSLYWTQNFGAPCTGRRCG